MGRVNYPMSRPDPFSSIVLGTSPFSCAPPKPERMGLLFGFGLLETVLVFFSSRDIHKRLIKGGTFLKKKLVPARCWWYAAMEQGLSPFARVQFDDP